MSEDENQQSSSPPDSGDQSRGGVLFAQAKARDQQRLQLWKSRVGLVKQARSLMQQKVYSDAAVAYEKYLRTLEIVFNCKKGEKITPEHFKESARTSELTVVTSVYWDLMRIYDSNSKYADRQMVAGQQLAKFLRFTPIFPDIVKKAQAFQRSAKNPAAFKAFLKASNQERPRCFIATSAFLYPEAKEVQLLRSFRDQYLKQRNWGRQFVLIYYRVSPPLACLLDKQAWLKPLIRGFLRLLIKCVS